MTQAQILRYLLLVLISIKSVHSLKIYIGYDKYDNNGNRTALHWFRNKSLEIPLFETRYLTVQLNSNDFRRYALKNHSLLGFKLQVASNNPDVIKFQKEHVIPAFDMEKKSASEILLEDLFIVPDTGNFDQVFNAYPSPSFIYLSQKSHDDQSVLTIWSVKGNTMGFTDLKFHVDMFYENNNLKSFVRSLSILVIQPKRRIDSAFNILVPIIIVIIAALMGVLLDTNVVQSILKKPIPVFIGFIAQYGLMPSLAIALGKVFKYTPLNSLALFIIGCCPGGGASNQWTILFGGDVNLSAIMSFVSTVASFIMMPIYFYTLGRLYIEELSISVPFRDLANALVLIVVPYGVGIAISHFFPAARAFLKSLVKPLMITLLLFFITFGVIVNWYLFKMIDLYTLLTAPLLPFLGFVFGALLAFICCREKKYIITIGIEAGIQNVSIAFLIIMYSFPQPYSTQALVVPMTVALLTPILFWVILIIWSPVNKFIKRRSEKQSTTNVNEDSNGGPHKNRTNKEQDPKDEGFIEDLQKL